MFLPLRVQHAQSFQIADEVAGLRQRPEQASIAVADLKKFERRARQIAPVQVTHARRVFAQGANVKFHDALQQRLRVLRLQDSRRCRWHHRWPRKGRAAVFFEPRHGLAFGKAVLAHDEVNDAAANVTAQTVEKIFGRRDVERWCFLFVERTQANVVLALLHQLDAPRLHHGHEVNALFEPG